MSEIKGQILGVILVLTIFAVVAASMTIAFRTASTGVVDQVSSIVADMAA